MAYWLVKSEPFKYSWDTLVKDGVTVWDGVRNYQARNNLMAMKKGDQVFFYHSNEGLAIFGIAKVSQEYYQDPTTQEKNWVAVNIHPWKPFKTPVTLLQIKSDPRLANMDLLRQGRLSVSSVSAVEWKVILQMTKQK